MHTIAKNPIAQYGILIVSTLLFLARMHRLWDIDPYSSNDFADPFLGAKMLVRGESPFNVNLAFHESYRLLPLSRHWHNTLYPILYPPSMLLLLAPLTYAHYHTINSAWFFISCAVYCFGTYALLRAVFTQLAWQFAVSLALLCVLPTYFGFNVECDQFGAVLAGLTFVFLACEISGKTTPAWICAAIVVCMKMTFAAPIAGVYLLRRGYRELAGLAVLLLVLNAAGFAMAGGMDAVRAYAHSVAVFDHAPTNAIDPRAAHGLDRTDAAYFAMGIVNNAPFAKALGYLIDLASVVAIAVLALRLVKSADRRLQICAVSGPLIALTIVGVYHQRYDLTLLIGVAVFCSWLLTQRIAKWPAVWILVAVGLQSIYDIDRFGRIVSRVGFLPEFFPKVVVSGIMLVILGLSLACLRGAAANTDEPVLAAAA